MRKYDNPTSILVGGLFLPCLSTVLLSLSVFSEEVHFPEVPVLSSSQSQAPGLWWTMARLVNLKTGGNMESFPGCSAIPFTPWQQQQCQKDSGSHKLMRALARASLATALECARQFQESRWNCPRFEKGPLFGRGILKKATKEAAFVHALMAASVTHETALACRRGELSASQLCDCSPLPPEALHLPVPLNKTTEAAFQWSFCNANIDYGSRFAEAFTSNTTFSGWGQQRLLLNKHNSRAGILKVKDNMRIRCKCHGLSGQCTVQICWHAVPNFRKVGNLLMSSYRAALRSAPFESQLGKPESAALVAVQAADQSQEDITRRLLYGEPSISFCQRREKLDVPGTSGRQCQPGSDEADSCDKLCCDRGYNTMRREEKQNCWCRFIWCCRVECRQCRRTLETSFCK